MENLLSEARLSSVSLASLSYPLAKHLNDLMVYAWLGLCLASFIISLVSFWRRGLVGFCFGLLSMSGAALCYFFMFGVFVAFDDPLGPFQQDSLFLNGLGLIGLTLFTVGARLGLRRKSTNCGHSPAID